MKTPKTNFVQLNNPYNFALRLNPKMCLDFEMSFQGRNLNAEIRVFGISNQYKDFKRDSNNTIQHIPHEYKLVLVYASQSFF